MQRPSFLFFDLRPPPPKSPKSRICAVGVRHRYVAKSLMYHTANTTSARPYTTFRPRNVDQITQWVDAARSARQANRRPLRRRPVCRLLQSVWRKLPLHLVGSSHSLSRRTTEMFRSQSRGGYAPCVNGVQNAAHVRQAASTQLPPPRSARSYPRSAERVPPRVA